MQHQQGVFPLWQQSPIASLERLLQWSRLHPTPVDKERHMLSIVLSQGAIADVAMQCSVAFHTYRYRIEHLGQGKVIEFCKCRSQVARSTCLQNDLIFNGKMKTDSWIAHGITPQQLHDMP